MKMKIVWDSLAELFGKIKIDKKEKKKKIKRKKKKKIAEKKKNGKK